MTERVQSMRRASYWTLSMIVALIAPLAGARGMRVEGIHQAVGILLFATVALSAWQLSRPPRMPAAAFDPRLRLAGGLLLAPFALIGLLWVGLGTPWDATAPENTMRYAVLLTGAVAITVGVFLLKDLLHETGERLYSGLSLAAGVLSGTAFVVWTSFQMGFHVLVVAHGPPLPAVAVVNNVLDALLFSGGCLAYVMTATLAHSLARAGWLGRRPALAYVLLNILAFALLLVRGLSFPTPGANPGPWYTRPGFVVGIPAMPWVMPYLLGAAILRRCGDPRQQELSTAA